MSDASLIAEPLRLPQALAARICHDIAGPLGALSATLDMLAEDGDPEALAIARESATMLSAKLRLLRAAWALEAEVPGAGFMQDLVAGLPGAERLRVTIGLEEGLPQEMRRLCLNLLLLAAASLPRGGEIRLEGQRDRLSLTIAGRDALWPAALNTLEPRGLAGPMSLLLADALGGRLERVSGTELVVRFRK